MLLHNRTLPLIIAAVEECGAGKRLRSFLEAVEAMRMQFQELLRPRPRLDY
jgi:hypothetical protein